MKKGRMNDKAGSDFEEMKGEDMEQAEKYEDKESSA
ncbi:unnamed protein product [Brugia timori]|uniref:Uncharacterized protein n=1 Tax=Brugia timori TaxID=42155 RepID=A0A3P7UJC8_9BILA|nr:unnamed protein product [Brugia timori]